MYESLVTIGQAARILGVSEVALRYWTDEGRIKAFVTPGGHRRYSKTELQNFISFHQNAVGVKELIDEIEATSKLHKEIVCTSLVTKEWYAQLSREKTTALSHLGREMLNIIIGHLNEPNETLRFLGYARKVGQGFGEALAGLKLSLTDSVEAFILHRDPIMKAVTHFIDRREAHTGTIVEAIPVITRILDEALLSLVEVHQRQSDITMEKGGERH